MSAPSIQLGRRAALPSPVARARHAAPRPAPRALFAEFADAANDSIVTRVLLGLMLGGLVVFAVGVLVGLVQ